MNDRHFFLRNSTYQPKNIVVGEDPVACYQDTFVQVVCEQLDWYSNVELLHLTWSILSGAFVWFIEWPLLTVQLCIRRAPPGTLMIHVIAVSGAQLLRQQRRFRAETTKHVPRAELDPLHALSLFSQQVPFLKKISDNQPKSTTAWRPSGEYNESSNSSAVLLVKHATGPIYMTVKSRSLF